MAHSWRVGYDHEIHGSPISFKRVVDGNGINRELAAKNMILLASTLGTQFEEPDGPVPEGTFARFYDPENEDRLASHHERMLHFVEERGSQYWFWYPTPEALLLGGLAKVSPSRPKEQGDDGEANVYINDVLVDPRHQNQRIGTSLLYTALKFGGFNEDVALVADAFLANPRLPEKLYDLGMLPIQKEVAPFEVDGHLLEQQRYVSLPIARLAVVRDQLEYDHEWLATGHVIDA